MKMRTIRRKNPNKLRLESLERRIVLSANPLVCDASGGDVHSIPFEVSGGGPAPNGLPLFPGGTGQHFATGEATRLGNYSGSAVFEFGAFTNNDPTTGTGTFSSAEPFIFTAPNGDQIAFDYGEENPGSFTVMPQGGDLAVIEFVAEFTLDPTQSTGRFAKYSEGSFIMVATTEPMSPFPDDNGFSTPFNYTWVGEGSISFPTGSTYQVTSKADSGPGSLRDAIEAANANEGIDTIGFARNVRGMIPLESELVISDDVTICGPGAHRLSLSGGDETRVLRVDPYGDDVPFGAPDGERIAVELHDLAIRDGFASDSPGIPTPVPQFAFGGGIYNRGSDVTLESVHLVGNRAGDKTTPIGAGGAIANEFGGTVTINESMFAGNQSVGSQIAGGGAITQDLGPTADGLGTKSAALVISESAFVHNSARALQTNPIAAGDFAAFAGFAFGGAIVNLAGDADVEDSLFLSNRVDGGVGVHGNEGGTAQGGAIFTLDFSPFIVPDAPGVVVPGRDARVTVEDSTFIRNASNGGDGDTSSAGGMGSGGAISAGISFFPDAALISGSTFIGNRATGGDGGRASDGGLGVGGGVAALAGASVTVQDASFIRNVAAGGQGGKRGTGGEGRGGAIGLALLNTPVETPFEGAPFIPSIFVSSASMLHNRAIGGRGGLAGGDGHGGGIFLDDGAVAIVDEVYIRRNSAIGGRGRTGGDGQGGGIFNGDSTVTLTASHIVRNSARGGSGRGRGNNGASQGGGLFNDGQFSIDQESLDNTRLNVIDDIFGDLSVL